MSRVKMTFYTYVGDEPIRVKLVEGKDKVVVQPGERFESEYAFDSSLFKTDEKLALLKNKHVEKPEKTTKPEQQADADALKGMILTLDPDAKFNANIGVKKLQEKYDALLEAKRVEMVEEYTTLNPDAAIKEDVSYDEIKDLLHEFKKTAAPEQQADENK